MAERKAHDFYATDPKDVRALAEFIDRAEWFHLLQAGRGPGAPRVVECEVLYPCAGGVAGETQAPYPQVFEQRSCCQGASFDIRPDADAEHAGVDFLSEEVDPTHPWTLAIDNPPFKLYRAFVEKALELAPVVVFLLPMQSREPRKRTYAADVAWWAKYRPTSVVTHPRLHFSGSKSSAFQEYAHFFWSRDKLSHKEPIQLFAIDDFK